MNLKSNAHELLTQVLAGEVWPALGDRHGFRVDPDGRPFLLPGMGGVTLGVHCGDPATGWAGDHIEPGLSVRHRNRSANFALQYLSCVGNRVVIASGPGAGAEGMVIGQHAYVLVDMDDSAMRQVTTGDQVTIFAFGQGMRLPDHREIALKNCSPGVAPALGGTAPDRRLEVHVAARVAADAIGAARAWHPSLRTPTSWVLTRGLGRTFPSASRACASVTSWRWPIRITGSGVATGGKGGRRSE